MNDKLWAAQKALYDAHDAISDLRDDPALYGSEAMTSAFSHLSGLDLAITKMMAMKPEAKSKSTHTRFFEQRKAYRSQLLDK